MQMDCDLVLSLFICLTVIEAHLIKNKVCRGLGIASRDNSEKDAAGYDP